MSRGQKPRTPAHFPRMKYRARKRVFRRIQRTYGMTLVHRWDKPGAAGWVRLGELTSSAWELSTDDPLDASAWLNSVDPGGES